MDRCALAKQYHDRGYNCAQSVLAAFCDLTKLPEEQAMAVASGIGGGFGGSHQEACGTLSGALMVLGLLYPHAEGENAQTKRRAYELTKEFRRRFEEKLGHTRCMDLLRSKLTADERMPAAQRLGVERHCTILVVTAVEMLEAYLQEIEQQA